MAEVGEAVMQQEVRKDVGEHGVKWQRYDYKYNHKDVSNSKYDIFPKLLYVSTYCYVSLFCWERSVSKVSQPGCDVLSARRTVKATDLYMT